jgi:hypothetical protein
MHPGGMDDVLSTDIYSSFGQPLIICQPNHAGEWIPGHADMTFLPC